MVVARRLHVGRSPSASGKLSSVKSDVGLTGPLFMSDLLSDRPSFNVALENERFTLGGESVKNLAVSCTNNFIRPGAYNESSACHRLQALGLVHPFIHSLPHWLQ